MKRSLWIRSTLPLLALALVACRQQPIAAVTEIDAGGEFQIEPYAPGTCEFDYRSQVTRLNERTGEVQWQIEVPWSWATRGAGALQDDTFAFNTEHGAGAVDLDDGSPLWQITDRNHFYALASTASALVTKVASENDSTLISREIRSGEPRWSRELDADTNPWFALISNVAIVNEHGKLVATDVDSGTEVWSLATNGDHSFAPVAVGDYLFHPAFEDGLYRIDPETGGMIWHWEPFAGAAVEDLITVVGDNVLFRTVGAWLGDDDEPPPSADQVVAVGLDSGEMLWSTSSRFATQGGDDYPGELRAGSTVVAIQGQEQLTTVDVGSGEALWTVDGPFFGSLAVEDTADFVFIAPGSYDTDGSVNAFAKQSGVEAWSLSVPQGQVTLRVDPELGLLVGQSIGNEAPNETPGGALYVVDPVTGEIRWERLFRDGVDVESVHRVEGSLIVRSADPTIFCD